VEGIEARIDQQEKTPSVENLWNIDERFEEV
jgi:hypothetical protein